MRTATRNHAYLYAALAMVVLVVLGAFVAQARAQTPMAEEMTAEVNGIVADMQGDTAQAISESETQLTGNVHMGDDSATESNLPPAEANLGDTSASAGAGSAEAEGVADAQADSSREGAAASEGDAEAAATRDGAAAEAGNAAAVATRGCAIAVEGIAEAIAGNCPDVPEEEEPPGVEQPGPGGPGAPGPGGPGAGPGAPGPGAPGPGPAPGGPIVVQQPGDLVVQQPGDIPGGVGGGFPELPAAGGGGLATLILSALFALGLLMAGGSGLALAYRRVA